jgi:hypothetical protein
MLRFLGGVVMVRRLLPGFDPITQQVSTYAWEYVALAAKVDQILRAG